MIERDGSLLLTPILRVEDISFAWPGKNGTASVPALKNLSLTIEEGEYVAVLGHNGSGKSTLARHLNGLLVPDSGDVWVREWNTREKAHLREIRTTVGMVFQQPDNQIVATIVEEDVAFGPENLGMAYDEMVRRVDWALGEVAMQPYRLRAPHLLSGGQKQRVAIAGVLAMQPKVLVLDEATAMLDPQGRKEVLEIAQRLNREQGVTVVAITHFMREALQATRVVVMETGEIALQGTPREIFAQGDRLRELQLDLPHVSQIAQKLHARFPAFPGDLLTAGEIVEAVQQGRGAVQQGRGARDEGLGVRGDGQGPRDEWAGVGAGEEVVSVAHLVHFYMRDTPLAVQALFDVNLRVRRGEIVGIIGHTGSGKSTVIQHLNGLLRPHAGKVVVLGFDTAESTIDVRSLRRRAGLVFQFPEAQLFEQYVGDDIAFGPRQAGLAKEEVRARVRQAMESLGLGFEEYKDRMTLGLSGGQKRRVALAGVLALEPELLILDEPSAGLDPAARRTLMEQILRLHDRDVTLVIVSHNMEELAAMCDRIYVLGHGRTLMEGSPHEIFAEPGRLREQGLDVPDATEVAERLAAEGLLAESVVVTTVDEAVEEIAALLA